MAGRALAAELLKLFECDVADTDHPGAAALLNGLHCPPGLPVGRRQAGPQAWSVQQEGIDHPGTQMFERAGEGLLNLNCDGSLEVIGEAVILPPLKGELGLQEELIAVQQAVLDRDGDAPTDSGLIVVPALVGRVDTTKALPQGELGQTLRLLLLPSGTVQEPGDANAVDRYGLVLHRLFPESWRSYTGTPAERRSLSQDTQLNER